MEFGLRFFLFFALAAADDYGSTNAKLEANITLQADRAWHLGGFCFGQAEDADSSKVAEIWIRVLWRGSVPLNDTGPVMLVAFDARESRWGAVKDSWRTSSCEEKLSSATMVRKLGQYSLASKYWFRVHVHQTSALRDWHFALLTCGEVQQAPLSLELEAADGALSMFQAGTFFHGSSCPAIADGWWQAARGDLSFWLVLVLAVLAGVGMTVCVLALRRYGTQRKLEQMGLVHGADSVVGKPCTLLGRTNAGVVQGKPHEALKEPAKGGSVAAEETV